jgi:hypothetical protein
MKHATPSVLDTIEPLLQRLRRIDGLSERSRGVFYRKGVATLHFHEDPAGLFADLKVKGAWRRLRVSTARERAALLREARRS